MCLLLRVPSIQSGKYSGVDSAIDSVGVAVGVAILKATTGVTGSMEGSGIGLATVARILEAHRGIIRLDPRYQNGARFYMRWPHHPSTK